MGNIINWKGCAGKYEKWTIIFYGQLDETEE